MGRRSDHSREELRTLALRAAEQLLEEEGLQGLSARKVAAAIGYTVGSLYLVFENLDDLILQVNARTLDDMYAFVTTAAADCAAPDACVLRLGRAYLQFAQSHPHRWLAIFEYRRNADPVVPEWFGQRIVRLFGLIEAPLGRLMPACPPPEVAQNARALWGGVHGICVLGLSHKLDVVGGGSMQVLLDSLIENYLAGLKTGMQNLADART